jgi:glycosidase
MDWVASAIWWHCFPMRFVGAEDRLNELRGDGPHHRLPQLTSWLDYVIELGCNGLLLGPIFAATSHGYDTLDYFRIDPGSATTPTSTAWSTPLMTAGSGSA